MGGGEHHLISLKTYSKVLLFLLFMTFITVIVAKPVSGMDFGVFNGVIAMIIASIKAGCVLAIFMHLKYDNKLYPAIFGVSIFCLILLYIISLLDIVSRVPETSTL